MPSLNVSNVINCIKYYTVTNLSLIVTTYTLDSSNFSLMEIICDVQNFAVQKHNSHSCM